MKKLIVVFAAFVSVFVLAAPVDAGVPHRPPRGNDLSCWLAPHFRPHVYPLPPCPPPPPPRFVGH